MLMHESLSVTSVAVQASVAAALSRDVLFGRTAPATYGLTSLMNNMKCDPSSASIMQPLLPSFAAASRRSDSSG